MIWIAPLFVGVLLCGAGVILSGVAIWRDSPRLVVLVGAAFTMGLGLLWLAIELEKDS